MAPHNGLQNQKPVTRSKCLVYVSKVLFLTKTVKISSHVVIRKLYPGHSVVVLKFRTWASDWLREWESDSTPTVLRVRLKTWFSGLVTRLELEHWSLSVALGLGLKRLLYSDLSVYCTRTQAFTVLGLKRLLYSDSSVYCIRTQSFTVFGLKRLLGVGGFQTR